MTHTFAILEISRGAFDEIAEKLRAAGYDHAFEGDTIDMHGIGVQSMPESIPEAHFLTTKDHTMTSHSTEAMIQATGLNAPRVTPQMIEEAIVSEHYFVGGDGVYGAAHKAGDHGIQQFPQALDLLTFCVLVLRNGFTVTGESACVSPENFDAEIGRKVARENAIDKVWPLEGYLLRDRLHHMVSA